MLALLGLLTILVLLAVIITKRMSPLVALIAVPVAAALVGGFGLDTGKFIVKGIRDVAPVAGMFIFAIIFSGVMADAEMLDPVIDRILRAVGSPPTRIVPGTALVKRGGWPILQTVRRAGPGAPRGPRAVTGSVSRRRRPAPDAYQPGRAWAKVCSHRAATGAGRTTT